MKWSIVATHQGNLQARAPVAIQLAVLQRETEKQGRGRIKIYYYINIARFTALTSVLSTLHFIRSSQKEINSQTDQ